METERFFSGFCKAINGTRMVICEFSEDDKGKKALEETDCAYGKCPHTADCLLMGRVLKEMQISDSTADPSEAGDKI